MMIHIDDLDIPGLEIYTKLNENQLYRFNEPENGLFIAESPLVIDRALDAGYEPVSMLTEESMVKKESADIIERVGDIPVYTAEEEVLTKLTGYKLTRGALCAMKRKALPDAGDIIKNCSRIAVLDNVVNPTNTGAIVRSAAALGMEAVLFTKDSCDPLYRRAIRVSMGTIFQIPWTVIEKSTDVKKYGFKMAAMALKEDSVSLRNKVLKKEEKLAVVLGSEGFGLSDETIAACDYTVMIPMGNGVDSLNVAAAGAVAFWELGKNT